MCMIFDGELTRQLVDGDSSITGYKIVDWNVESEHIRSPYFYHRWEPGRNASNRYPSLMQTEIASKKIDYGIHVFLNRHDADEVLHSYCSKWQMVAEVVCHLEHLIAAGKDESTGRQCAVFTEVFVEPEEHSRLVEFGKSIPASPVCDDDDDDDYWDDEDDWDDDDEDDEDYWDDDEDDEDDDWEDDDWDEDEDWEDDEE